MNKKLFRLSLLPLVLAASVGFIACGDDDDDDDDGGVSATLTQIDRMGFPAVNTALIPSNLKDAFNQGDPATDSRDFCDVMIAQINGLRAAVAAVPGFPPADGKISPEAVANIVCPDVVALDLSQPNVFPNGRPLNADVIDPTLGVVLDRGDVLGGGPGVSDGIALDSTFRREFPFLGVPNP